MWFPVFLFFLSTVNTKAIYLANLYHQFSITAQVLVIHLGQTKIVNRIHFQSFSTQFHTKFLLVGAEASDREAALYLAV